MITNNGQVDISITTPSPTILTLLSECGLAHLADVLGVARVILEIGGIEEEVSHSSSQENSDEIEQQLEITNRHGAYHATTRVPVPTTNVSTDPSIDPPADAINSGVTTPFRQKWQTVSVVVKKTAHEKCPRCWRYVCDAPNTLCDRCARVCGQK